MKFGLPVLLILSMTNDGSWGESLCDFCTYAEAKVKAIADKKREVFNRQEGRASAGILNL